MAEKPMILEIVVPDRYLDITNRAVNCAKGDTIKTRVPYGQTLVNAGLATPVAPPKMASEPATAAGGPADLSVVKLNIDDVLEAIKDGDLTPEEALETELDRGQNARPTLVKKLEAIIGFGEELEAEAPQETGPLTGTGSVPEQEAGDEENG